MIYFLIVTLALILLLAFQYFNFAKREKSLVKFWSGVRDNERAHYQNEREKLLDRLMARNFEELKIEQHREKTEPLKEEPENIIPAEDMTEHDWKDAEAKEEAHE